MEAQHTKRKFRISFTSLIAIALLAFFAYRLIAGSASEVIELPYSAFKTSVNEGKISSVIVSASDIEGTMSDGTAFTTVRVEDPDLVKTLENQTGGDHRPGNGWWGIGFYFDLDSAICHDGRFMDPAYRAQPGRRQLDGQCFFLWEKQGPHDHGGTNRGDI